MSANRILVKSSHRVSGTASDFTLYWRDHIPRGRYRVSSITLPSTIYNVDGWNGSLRWEFDGGAPGPFFAVLPPGQYTGAVLAAALKTAMEAADGSRTYDVAYSTLTSRLTFTISGAGALSWLWSSVSVTSAHKVVGYATAVDTANTASPFSPPLACDLSFPISLGIVIAGSGTRAFDVATRTLSPTIYVRFVPAHGAYEIQDDDIPQIVEFTHDLSVLEVRLYDTEFGRLVDMHGGEWEMLLRRL